ncbi:hypothetical protein GCM10025876_02650 [Demequina litorisediminis]|uniref:Glutamate-ammonia ligase adenylyltransferase repeated domain-containing protein n=1 Tax=Demequina litorisediminis TaxID=1849022 RepID=A0ABQ6I8M4_9MICO|nr:hypothetical protein GCM10025876_02650 [Demequina litorisediminis]
MLQRTHLMPEDEEGRRALARASGFATLEYMDEVWHDIRRDVRAMHLEMFYRPILPMVASLSADEARLDDAAARARLAAVGFDDAQAAQRHIAALTEGSPDVPPSSGPAPCDDRLVRPGRRARRGPARVPEASENLADAQWYLKLLRDSSAAAQRLARLLSTSAYVTDALLASAESIPWLDNDADLAPRSRERLRAEADAILRRSADAEQCITALRGLRRRELARVASADVLGLITPVEAAASVSDSADVLIEGAVRIASAEVASDAGLESLPVRFLVVAMGRYGGSEMGYTSDADVQFVWSGDHPDGQKLAVKVAQRVRKAAAVRVEPARTGDRCGPTSRGAQRSARTVTHQRSRVLRPLVGPVGGAGAAACPTVRGRRPGSRRTLSR